MLPLPWQRPALTVECFVNFSWDLFQYIKFPRWHFKIKIPSNCTNSLPCKKGCVFISNVLDVTWNWKLSQWFPRITEVVWRCSFSLLDVPLTVSIYYWNRNWWSSSRHHSALAKELVWRTVQWSNKYFDVRRS